MTMVRQDCACAVVVVAPVSPQPGQRPCCYNTSQGWMTDEAVHGPFRRRRNRPGVYAGLACTECGLLNYELSQAVLRASFGRGE